MEKIKITNISKIFGPQPGLALQLLNQGLGKEEIFNQTGQAVGLANISFDIQEGEIMVVMGLSGSGKSTLLRCLNRLIDPSQGQVFIDGVDIMTLDHEALLALRRQKFGMVFQHFALFPHRNILQNVEYGLEIQGVDVEKRRDKARQSLKLVGLEGWEDAMPRQLSGGMQQRVGLARALAVEPDILLMDEAFSALDPLIRGDMQNELLLLQERVRKTIVFITHDLDEALKIGSRVVLMKDGRVVQVGTPEDIINQPADDYVKRFVENVDRSRLLTAHAVMVQPHVFASPNETPESVLTKMEDENFSSLVVVNPDQTLAGMVRLETVTDAKEAGAKTIEQIVERDVPTVTTKEPLAGLIAILTTWPLSLPVLDKQRKLLGIVVKGAILSALAKRGNH